MGQRLFRSTTPVVPITEEILIVPEPVVPVAPVAQVVQVAEPVVEEKSSEDNAKDKDKLQEVLKGILRDY
jgi:hypothetical protein